MTSTYSKIKYSLQNHTLNPNLYGHNNSKIKSTASPSNTTTQIIINTSHISLTPESNSKLLKHNWPLSYQPLQINSYSDGEPSQEDNLKIYKSHSNKPGSSQALSSTLIMESPHYPIKSESNFFLLRMQTIIFLTDSINFNTLLMYPSQVHSKPVKSSKNSSLYFKNSKEFNSNHTNSEFVKESHKKSVKFIDKNL